MSCIFLCGLFSTNAVGQRIFEKADSLFALGHFTDARIECERVIFGNPKNEIQTKALLRVANCYKQEAKFEQALTELNRIATFNLAEDVVREVKYETLLCMYLSENFKMADNNAKQIHFFSKDSVLHNNILLLEALISGEIADWETAKNKALQYVDYKTQNADSVIIYKTQIEEHFNKKNIPRLKNPEKAELLSTFVPGTGQIYAGHIGEGLGSFALQVTFLGIGAYGFYKHYFVSGYFIGFGIFQKFYFGGSNRAKILAQKRNYIEMRKFNDGFKNILLGV